MLMCAPSLSKTMCVYVCCLCLRKDLHLTKSPKAVCVFCVCLYCLHSCRLCISVMSMFVMVCALCVRELVYMCMLCVCVTSMFLCLVHLREQSVDVWLSFWAVYVCSCSFMLFLSTCFFFSSHDFDPVCVSLSPPNLTLSLLQSLWMEEPIWISVIAWHKYNNMKIEKYTKTYKGTVSRLSWYKRKSLSQFHRSIYFSTCR